MAFPTANVRIETRTLGFGAIGFNLYALLTQGKLPAEVRFQDHVRAGIGHLDARHGAGLTQFGPPGQNGRSRPQEAAFLHLPAAVVIPVEKAAFFTRRCTHALA